MSMSNDLLSPIRNVREGACRSLDQSCTCKWLHKTRSWLEIWEWGIETCILCVTCKSILLNEFSLLLLFCTGKKLIHFKICWDSWLNRVWYSAVGLICISTPSTGTRGLNVVWIPYQTARCALPSGPVRRSKEKLYSAIRTFLSFKILINSKVNSESPRLYIHSSWQQKDSEITE